MIGRLVVETSWRATECASLEFEGTPVFDKSWVRHLAKIKGSVPKLPVSRHILGRLSEAPKISVHIDKICTKDIVIKRILYSAYSRC